MTNEPYGLAAKFYVRLPSTVERCHGQLIEYLNGAIECAKLPEADQLTALTTLYQQQTRSTHPFARYFAPYPIHIIQASRLQLVYERCMLAALAAERFRLRHGRFPKSLDELVKGGLLPTIPVDPYLQQPLRIARKPGVWIVYSVGSDGREHGGYLYPRSPRSDPETDLGITLYDPHLRSQEPVPPLP